MFFLLLCIRELSVEIAAVNSIGPDKNAAHYNKCNENGIAFLITLLCLIRVFNVGLLFKKVYSFFNECIKKLCAGFKTALPPDSVYILGSVCGKASLVIGQV